MISIDIYTIYKEDKYPNWEDSKALWDFVFAEEQKNEVN